MTKRVTIPPARNPILTGGQLARDWRRFHELTAEQLNQTAEQGDTDHTALADLIQYVNISGSFVTGCTLTGHDNSTNATITISDHFRFYHSGSVAITGDSLTAAYDTDVWLYYDDEGREGGAVTYAAATFYADAFPTATHPNRHFVGSIHTPAALASDTAGKPVRPPGYNEP